MQLTKNFHLDEFECKSGADMPDDVLDEIQFLAENLQKLRDRIGKSITITSGYRSPDHNRKIGGATVSQHIFGRAADIKVRGWEPDDIANEIQSLIDSGDMVEGGIGIYKSWTHYDTRQTRARW